MADGSQMLTYLLYVVLVIVLATAGWHIGGQWGYKQVGAVFGGLVGGGIVFWHRRKTSVENYAF